MQDIEQMVTAGKKSKSCPYYAGRYAIRDAQVGYERYLLVVFNDKYSISLPSCVKLMKYDQCTVLKNVLTNYDVP